MVVLILIVVDNGLVQCSYQRSSIKGKDSLNPYCSGQWSRTITFDLETCSLSRLNPYCSGQWPRTVSNVRFTMSQFGLNPYCSGQWPRTQYY